MRLTETIHIVASGDSGFSLTSAFDCTVYLVDGGTECALVDAGSGVAPQSIVEQIRAAGFVPEQIGKILLTHAHADHAGGAAALAEMCDAQVYAMLPAADYVTRGDAAALSLDGAVKAGAYPQGHVFPPCPVLPLRGGDCVAVGTLSLTVIEAQGHSAGHCCYALCEAGQTSLFTGDAIQHGGKIALQAIWDCDLQQYVKTIRRLAALQPDAIFPAHGCFALRRGGLHTDKAAAALETLALPKNSIGE